MRWTQGLAGALIATIVGTAAMTFAATSKPTAAGKSGKSANAGTLARGKYLVTIMGCNDCHTPGTFYGAPDMSRFLSGSELGWAGPWGIVFASNLTPDNDTGLGYWSVDEIAKAIRTGNTPNGRQLAPLMPWLNFSSLTDDDAKAIAVYLQSLPPVSHKVPAPLPPGVKHDGAVVEFPPPPAWDAPREKPGGR